MKAMSDLRRSPYTDRIIEVTGADHREALIVETALRWGFGNSGTLDHLDAREFDRQVLKVAHVLAAHPSERETSERLAEVEHLIPPAPGPDGVPRSGDRVRVWFTGNGVVAVEASDDPRMRPYRIRLDGADADTYHHADQVRPEVVDERRPVRPDRCDGPTAMPATGERFVLTADVERHPHFVAARGSKGTVADVSCGAISLRLDDPLPGAEEWDNEVVWGDGVGRDFWEDVERLSPGDDRPQEHPLNAEEEAGWLVEWDGGWDTAATPQAAEKIAEWGDGDRGEFRIVPNEPPPEDMAGRAT